MNTSEYILVAEDDEDDQLLLNSAFREVSGGKQLVFVNNGIELLEFFSKIDEGHVNELPSLLIVDLNMPRKNGREAIHELVGRNDFRQFPTVIFSTTGSESERSKCRELGVDEYFVKPSNYKELLVIVKHFCDLADASVE